MNKKISLSKSTVIIIVMLLVLAVYGVVYMVPAQSELTLMRAETSVAIAEAAVYRQYLTDSSPLEADISAIQAEIDTLYSDAYTNESNVSFDIGSAIQRNNVSVSSMTLSNTTIIDGNKALPINLTIRGEFTDVLNFIKYFEENQEGSYLVHSAAMDVSGTTANAALVVYLCTPNV